MQNSQELLESPKYFIEVEIINKIVKAITRSFDLDEVGQSIVDSIVKYLNSPGGTLLLADYNSNCVYAHSTSSTPLIKRIVRMLGKSFRSHVFSFEKEPMTLIARTVKEKKTFQSKKYEEFISPVIPVRLAHIIQKLARIGNTITLPVIIEKKVLGVLFISFHEEVISPKLMAILSIFADHAAIAINNALKYEELKKNYEMEKEVASTLAHELKTPIAIAHHSAQTMLMMLEKYKEDLDRKISTELVKTARDIQHGMDRLTRICTSIFSLREVENKVPEDIHLIDLKKQLSQILFTYERKAYEKGISFEYHLDECKKKYYGGIIQLEQIITILLDNAVKYTESGNISLLTEFKEKKLICKVTDTGCGIPKKQRHLVFGRFYRNVKDSTKKHKAEGLGLGLYIAKKIIEEIKGDIKIESNRRGKGTCISVQIPVYPSRKIRNKNS